MSNRKPLAFLGVLIVAALAAGTVMYMQDREDAQAFQGEGQASAAAPVQGVPEAGTVHAGSRPGIPMDHTDPIPIKIYASPTCGCCELWVEYVADRGFEVEVVHRHDMGAVKEALGVPARLASCHTAVVNDYVVEGHVPAEDLRRFLAEAPEALGLTVPGMPLGSPGMEVPTGEVHEYEVLSFTADGATTVFARHGPDADR